uniref:Uncharacterized protein n=1 Tax=Arundo donax TaxID=35708 RepID=A0A0A8YA01_ARUDO
MGLNFFFTKYSLPNWSCGKWYKNIGSTQMKEAFKGHKIEHKDIINFNVWY